MGLTEHGQVEGIRARPYAQLVITSRRLRRPLVLIRLSLQRAESHMPAGRWTAQFGLSRARNLRFCAACLRVQPAPNSGDQVQIVELPRALLRR
jgi:hypothetical protein